MRKMFDAANRFMETSDWKTLAVMKFCLISLGVMLGMCVGKRHKRKVFAVTGPVFLATYVPLMLSLYKIYRES